MRMSSLESELKESILGTCPPAQLFQTCLQAGKRRVGLKFASCGAIPSKVSTLLSVEEKTEQASNNAEDNLILVADSRVALENFLKLNRWFILVAFYEATRMRRSGLGVLNLREGGWNKESYWAQRNPSLPILSYRSPGELPPRAGSAQVRKRSLNEEPSHKTRFFPLS